MSMTNDEDTKSTAPVTSSRAESCTTTATQPKDTTVNSSNSTSFSTVRQVFGKWTVRASEVINDNLILVRYGTITSIVLLSTYGFYKTPLFFRYKSVSDIPCMSFQRRHKLHGRIVHVKRYSEDSKSNRSMEEPFILYLYHLSPVQRLLNHSAFNLITRQKFWKSSWKQIEERNDLLKVELAGVKYPSTYQAQSYIEQDSTWLQSFTNAQPSVTIQLLSRRVLDMSTLARRKEVGHSRVNDTSSPVVDQSSTILKHVYHEVGNENTPMSIDNMEREQTAICKVLYRPREKGIYRSMFRNDMAMTLVQHGRVEVLSSGLYVEMDNKRMVDGSEGLPDITSDVSYMETLMKAEQIAIQERKGLWSNEAIRKEKEKFIGEVLAEAKTSIWKRLWNWILDRRR